MDIKELREYEKSMQQATNQKVATPGPASQPAATVQTETVL